MNEKIMDYELREEIKLKGWAQFREAHTIAGKAQGILSVIESHYWRQRENLEFDRHKKTHLRLLLPKKYSPGYELDIDHYTCHWLCSMSNFVPKEVNDYLSEYMGYKPVETKFLPEGMTIYQFKDVL